MMAIASISDLDTQFAFASAWMLLLASQFLIDAVIGLGVLVAILVIGISVTDWWRDRQRIEAIGPLFHADGSLACICHHHRGTCDCAGPDEPAP